MESVDGQSDADYLEVQLLTDPVENADSGKILHTATFSDFEERFVNYETLQWIVISLLLIPAWGVGVVLLLYTPIRRYIMRRDFRLRKLYVTSDAIVYKATRPAFIPWLGVSKIDKCILLPLITDIVLEQGCLQSIFGLHSLRIETLGQGPLDAYGISVCGMTNPRQFRKVVLMAASIVRKDGSLPEQSPIHEGDVVLGLSKLHFPGGSQSHSFSSPRATMDTPRQVLSPRYADVHDRYQSTSGEVVLRKLEDVRLHAKKLEALILRQQGQALEILSDVSDPEG
ncbi:hypothetical protein GOP47_0014338 [Adiantum capillus-veneris]|uniref:DUF7642 domain-containing protein n=1 Tax=Adiantum capillus-veneris TaxID=13818 RepID=A0A9D4ULG1_ADICA|nr:hypothetical protein GOP47_0014338 [Adiantum capillus-veneris]